MFNLVNKVAIVTGASRGIGKAIAEAVAQAGAHVVCVSRSENELIKISSNLNENGMSSSYFVCDVSDLEVFNKLAKDTISKYIVSKLEEICKKAVSYTHLTLPTSDLV